MICLLKNGKRVWYGGKEPEDKKALLMGTLLCEIRYNNNFDYEFSWEQVEKTY